jgi:hypothetical protein
MADTATVRRWAREQGLPVGDRGRISPDLVAAYSAAHGSAGSSVPARGTALRAPSAAPRRSRAGSRGAAVPAPGPAPAQAAASLRGTSPAAGRTVRARTPWDWPRR